MGLERRSCGAGTSSSPTHGIAKCVRGRRGRRPSGVEVGAGSDAVVYRRFSMTVLGAVPRKAVLKHTHSTRFASSKGPRARVARWSVRLLLQS